MPSTPDCKTSRRIGFIVGKTCDVVEDPLFKGDCSFLKALPNSFRVHHKRNRYLKYCEESEQDAGRAHVDVAIAWYIHKNFLDLEVDIIEPGEVCSERLSANVCNFIIGWDLIDAALEGPERLLEMADAFRRSGNVVPSLDVQEFIYYKSRYLKACLDAGVPIAPTIFVHKGRVNARSLLQEIKARGWKEFVIKKSFNCWSLGFVRYTLETCEKNPEVLDKYFEMHIECPEFIVQEALSGFARHWETRVFWWGGTFVYAVANKAAVATQSKEIIITGKDIPEEFLANAKRIGREALNLLPELRTPKGHPIAMTLIRTDIGCSEGEVCDLETNWDPNKKTFFLNEIEYGGTNYFARHLKFDCVPLWAEKYAKKATEIIEKDGPSLMVRPDVAMGTGDVRVPKLMQPQFTLEAVAHWLTYADALLVGSGPGMCANAELFAQACDPAWLDLDPQCAWGFWHGSYAKFAESKPHAGYEILRSIAEGVPAGAFSVTASTDGHWAQSGWWPDRLVELNGSFGSLQCRGPGCSAVWPRDAQGGPPGAPRCPACGGAARPCVRMAEDDGGFCEAQLGAQRGRLAEWQSWSAGVTSSDPGALLVCLELGCEAGSPVREALRAAWPGRSRLIRINSVKSDVEVHGTPECPAVSVHMNVRNALYEIQRVLQSVERVSFICQDSKGNGAEVSAPMDASVAHVIRKAMSELGWVFIHAPEEGPVHFVAHNVGREPERQDVGYLDSVPAKMFFTFGKEGHEAPVTRIIVHSGYFTSRNARLEARSSEVQSIVTGLNEGFSHPEYQRRLDEAKDRITVQAMIREVQLQVMEKNGFPVAGAKPKRLHELVIHMKGFNYSGMHGLQYLQDMVDKSFEISGVQRLDALPRRVKD